MKNLQHFTDGTAAAHQFSVVQYGGLAGGGSTLRLVKNNMNTIRSGLRNDCILLCMTIPDFCSDSHRFIYFFYRNKINIIRFKLPAEKRLSPSKNHPV